LQSLFFYCEYNKVTRTRLAFSVWSNS